MFNPIIVIFTFLFINFCLFNSHIFHFSTTTMRIFLIIFLSILFSINSQILNPQNLVFITKFECFLSNEFTKIVSYPNVSCTVKFYSRKVSTISFYGVLRKPLNKFYVRKYSVFLWIKNQHFLKLWGSLFFKEGSQFREVIRSPKVEACDLLKSSSDNFLLKHIVERLKENFGDLMHECPYSGVRIFIKFSLNLII